MHVIAMLVTHRAFQRVTRSWVNHPIQLYHLPWSRTIALELLWLISIYLSVFLCNNLSSNENQSKYFMLSNQQSAHQLVSFSILSTLQGRRRFQPRLQFSPLFKLRVLRYFANEAVAMVASARREKPHIASQPAT